MYLFQLLMRRAITSEAFIPLTESKYKCEGNIPCDIESPDPQEEINNSHYQRTRRSSETDPCVSITEEEPLTYEVPGAPKTLLNEILTQKIKQTRCSNEGAKCQETWSILMGYSYICETKTSSTALNFKTDTNESIAITVPINVACECVRQ
ncbi:uncharacterized protein LOC134664717 [Cydia fagiglandana]|uniref:uncharacterized protein LOC134664717 n=1 Tax=Cydia fagiglandana TaxID=1458189 RepID=UPI002FEE188E